MPSRSLYYFRGDVVWSPADCSFLFLRELQLSREAEVSYFEFHTAVDEDVSHLEISMDDTIGVHVLDSREDL